MKKRIISLAATVMLALSSTSAYAECVKHQRVYGIIDADGQVQSVTDYVHLENRDGADVLQDMSRLTEIEPLHGNGSLSVDGPNLIWETDGRDIGYQGVGTEELNTIPQVTMLRNGREISGEEVKAAEGPVTLHISYRMKERTPLLFVNLILLPEEAELMQAAHAETFLLGGMNVVVGWALPGMDPALGLPETFDMTVDLHGKLPEWILAVGTSGILSEAAAQIHPYFEEAGELTEDIRSILKAWENGEDMPEVRSEQLRDMLREMVDNDENGNEEQAGGTTLQTLHMDISALGLNTGKLEQALKKLKEKAAEQSKHGQTLIKAQKNLSASAGTLETDAGGIAESVKVLSEQIGALEKSTAAVTANAASVTTSSEKLKTKATGASTEAGKLGSAAAAAAESAKTLSSGIGTQNTQTRSIKSGIETLKTLITTAKSGTEIAKTETTEAKSGVESLKCGVDALQAELNSLSEGSSSLHAEAKALMEDCLLSSHKVLEMLLADIGLGVPELNLENYGQILEELEASLNEETLTTCAEQKIRTRLFEGADDQEEAMTAAETGVRILVLESVLAQEGLNCTAEEYERKIKAGYVTTKTQRRIRQAVESMMADEEILAAVQEQAEGQIEETIDTMMMSDEVRARIQDMVKAMDAESIRHEIRAVRGRIDRMHAFVKDLSAYAEKTGTAATDAAGLQTASTALSGTVGKIAAQAAALAESTTSASGQVETLLSETGSLCENTAALGKTAGAAEKDLKTLAQNAASVYAVSKELKTDAETLWTGAKAVEAAVGSLETGRAGAAKDAAALKTAVTKLQSDTGAMKGSLDSCLTSGSALAEGIAAIAKDAGTLQAQTVELVTASENLKSGLSGFEEAMAASPESDLSGLRPIAASLLSCMESSLQNALNLYMETCKAIGEGSNYDPVPEGMTGDTLYLFRLNLQ